MLNFILFLVVVLLANIIQGITGFAGTILAMPFSLMLVGYGTAKPILNLLGLLAGVYVFLGNREHVNWKELKKIVVVMAVGILCGTFIKGFFIGTPREKVLYIALGLFTLFLSVNGLYKQYKAKTAPVEATPSPTQNLLLGLAGLVHGVFVCGGPLLIGYLTSRVKEKVQFRSTISTCWIFLNGLILATELVANQWSMELAIQAVITVPFLLLGMFIGGKLCARMSQEFFLKLTYVLLFISGLSLLIK